MIFSAPALNSDQQYVSHSGYFTSIETTPLLSMVKIWLEGGWNLKQVWLCQWTEKPVPLLGMIS